MRHPSSEHPPRQRSHAAIAHQVRPARAIALATLASALASCGTLRERRADDLVQVSANTPTFAAAHDDEFRYCPLDSVRQPSAKSCGIAALTAVMNYWDIEGEVGALEKKYPADSDNGYPLLQLRRIATKEGLIAFALTMKERPLDQISEQLENGRPIITPVLLPRGRYFGRDFPVVGRLDATTVNPDKQLVGGTHKHHYVVVFGQSDDKLLLMDPAYGIVQVPKSEFTHYWAEEKYAALLCSSF